MLNCSTLVNVLNYWVCYPLFFNLIGQLKFELGILHFKIVPTWVHMNFQLGILVTVFMKVANTLQDILSDINRVLEVLRFN